MGFDWVIYGLNVDSGWGRTPLPLPPASLGVGPKGEGEGYAVENVIAHVVMMHIFGNASSWGGGDGHPVYLLS